MEQPVRIFKCPCEGNKFKLAGIPNDNPTLKEKKRIWRIYRSWLYGNNYSSRTI